MHLFWKIGIACVLLGADQATKSLVSTYFPLGLSVPLAHFLGIDLSITYTVNTGAAWGFFAAFPGPLVIFRILFVALLAAYLCFGNRQPSWQFPLILIIAGATGNIIDIFLRGHVVDMIHFVFWGYHFAVFNVADSVIFIGTFWLLLTKKEKNGSRVVPNDK